MQGRGETHRTDTQPKGKKSPSSARPPSPARAPRALLRGEGLRGQQSVLLTPPCQGQSRPRHLLSKGPDDTQDHMGPILTASPPAPAPPRLMAAGPHQVPPAPPR